RLRRHQRDAGLPQVPGLMTWGAPTWPPKPPSARGAPAEPWRASVSRPHPGAPRWPPNSPRARPGPARPWRPSISRQPPRAPRRPPTSPSARRAPAEPWRASISRQDMGGPEMAQTPQRSSRPGGAVARLDLAPAHGGPEMAPQLPQRSGRPGGAVTPLDLAALEAALDHRFVDLGLLTRALTHASYVNEHPPQVSQDGLAFVGDAALGLVLAQRLLARAPDAPAGALPPAAAA